MGCQFNARLPTALRLPRYFAKKTLYPFRLQGGERHHAQEHNTMTLCYYSALKPITLKPESHALTIGPTHLPKTL